MSPRYAARVPLSIIWSDQMIDITLLTSYFA
jgi:hypothetical protein